MWFELAMKLGVEVLKQMPDYTERKEKKFYKLKEFYTEQLSKPAHLRNDEVLANAREDLANMLQGLIK